ncbi:pyruvate carboxylase [bacterium]|nr:pyruvate carboxylase [bacterium]
MQALRIQKLLVANRGEIAIRICRAANELGIHTVAIYSHEDRMSMHRQKADEAYLVGRGREPVKAYLDIEDIIRIAHDSGADAVHPGYGFLSENPDFAGAVRESGLIFVGPPTDVLRTMGDKTLARKAAQDIGIPVIPGTRRPTQSHEAARREARRIGFPLMLKAAMGGGGRGMRIVRRAAEFDQAFKEASREAAAAFGSGLIFMERLIETAKHIEVQILADDRGNCVHLFDRDCSIQRRHQKMVEIAPSLTLPEPLREKLFEDAVRLARSVGYENAGTVEFLVEGRDIWGGADKRSAADGRYYFIEMNPRLQVEHTVTETVTGVDIVASQIRLAAGVSLEDIGLASQSGVTARGFALQCRITTEDPYNNFIPDHGRLAAYRTAAGFGIRLDGGNAYHGAIVTPYYDSLLVKVTSHANDFQAAVAKMRRALAEFRIRGLRTNIPFLLTLLAHPAFQSGGFSTRYVEQTPELFKFSPPKDRANRLLRCIADIIVNGNPQIKPDRGPPARVEPVIPGVRQADPPDGMRQKWRKMGTAKFCGWIREQRRLLVTDTTFRDAHQSLLATRVRTHDLIRIAPAYARNVPELFSIEMWGGATFDVAMRFLGEDPWERLERLREAIPNILFQMLLRGANAVGYTAYPDNVVRAFIRQAAKSGIDLFRIFDSLNNVSQMRKAIDAARSAGGIAEAALCYTGDIDDPARAKFDLRYYARLARELKKAGADMLAIKDMAGLLKPYAAYRLVRALRDSVDLPIHLHTHDTSGIQASTILRAADAGVDIADAAMAAFSGLTSQPNLNSLVAALARQTRDTGIPLEPLNEISRYFEDVRGYYTPFESGLQAGTAEVYEHEIPGGQYSNLRPQAEAMGLGGRITELKKMYATVNRMFGDIVKVTPSSKVVGDMACFMLANNLTEEDVLDRGASLAFPESVVGFFRGELGRPAGGFPKKLQRIVLRGKAPLRSPRLPPANFAGTRAEVEKKVRRKIRDTELLSYFMYPQIFVEWARMQAEYGEPSVLPTPVFFHGLASGEEIQIDIEKGKTLIVKYLAVSDPDHEGRRTLFFELNGQPREVVVIDKSLGREVKRNRKAELDNPAHVAAPMPGLVVSIAVSPGQSVSKDSPLASIQAMKMETTLYAPQDGKIAALHVRTGSRVESGDLIMEYEQ